MVVNNISDKLIEIGFSEYEAKAYLALIVTYPATAYEIARMSGIPSSKIYEVLSKLRDKRIVSVIDADNKKKYAPISPVELIESARSKLDLTLSDLKDELLSVKMNTDVSYIWNVHDYDYLIEKTNRMMKSAENTILLSGWTEEIKFFESIINTKKTEKIKTAIVHFGEEKISAKQVFQHPIKDTIYSEKGGRGFVAVVDSKQALIGTVLSNNIVEGAWSMNKGFVTLAEDYVKHDIYIMKIVSRFNKLLIKKFGENYIKLRDIFSDNEV